MVRKSSQPIRNAQGGSSRMMDRVAADVLRDQLEPLLPDNEVTSVPWHEHERGEWIVTVWDSDGVVLADIFGLGGDEYVLREIGLGRVIGVARSVAEIPEIVRTASSTAYAG